MEKSTTECADSVVETIKLPHGTIKAQHTTTKLLPAATGPQHQTVSLVDLPLELLLMIFDYAACRDHLKNKHYSIRLKRGEGSSDSELVVSQPALLMVSPSLRSALSRRFYSSCSFHAKIGARSMLKSFVGSLTVQQIEDKLPHPLKLSTIKLTIEVHGLSEWGFDSSVLIELGKKLFDEYRTTKMKEGDTLMNLRWRLVCTDTSIKNHCDSPYNRFAFCAAAFSDDLRLLLEEVHMHAARSARLNASTLQTFSACLEKWLKGQGGFENTSYLVGRVLRVISELKNVERPQELLWWYYGF
jgi:hypothetical protein